MGEICKITAGGDLPKKYLKGQKKPTKKYTFPIYSNGVGENALYGYSESYRIEKKSVTVSARGTIGYHCIRDGKFTPIVRLITLLANEKILSTEFLYYALFICEIKGIKTGVPSLTVPMIKKIKIPIPPLYVQEQVVKILDKFDKLVNDISTGLPAEIKMRNMQYEYYRDKLLDFPKK